MSLTDSLKDHIVVVVSTVAVGSFGAGWAAYNAMVGAQGQELILKTQRLALEQKANELEGCRRIPVSATAPDPSACRALLAPEIDTQYLKKTDVQRDYVSRSQLPEAPKVRPSFDSQWRYFAMANAEGAAVARRLTEIGPPQDAVVIAYDGSSHNTFHVWYRGQGTHTRYEYLGGRGSDFADPPRTGFFLSESGVIPAGIGGIGNTAVPIYFVATK
jgi:hypothetical protein